MKRFTTLALVAAALLLSTRSGFAQDSEFLLTLPNSEDITSGYATGRHSGARAVAGPYDLDGDDLQEILVTDYTGGGRVHVIENVSADTWELVYSTPWLDSTATTDNLRTVVGADLDGDGFGEIIFFAGRLYSEFNPDIATLVPGLYVFEHDGSDNSYGDAPTSIYTFTGQYNGIDLALPDRWRQEQIAVADVDGDGVEELMFGNNGAANGFDTWYILSVNGDLGSGFETWVAELLLSSRATEDYDPVARGGGSPIAIHPADLDGDGNMDLSMHAWNSFNFVNAKVTGPDTYVAPADGAPNGFLQASAPDDHVSLFGGVVVDIDGDGNDEVFYPRFQAGNVLLLNYETTEDVLQITEDNVVLNLLTGFTSLGITAGDIDGDGAMELIGAGPSYSATNFGAGTPPVWARIAEFNGGDPEDPANYFVTDLAYSEDSDMDGAAFDTIVRDSAGVMTEYLETGAQGPEFVSKLVYLGDADLDGLNEVALALQGIDDSTYVISEVFNPADSTYSRTITSSAPYANRTFLRVISGSGTSVSIQDERIVLPSDYQLHANYPNPFNPTTTLSFTLPLEKAVSVRIYDITGRLVRTLINNQVFPAGTFDVSWDGTSDAGTAVASGSYLYSMEYGNFRQSRTMVLAK